MNLTSLKDLLLSELNDLYDAEIRIGEALPKMAAAAQDAQLQEAFHEHLSETQNHVLRLERIFTMLGSAYDGETCEATQGLIIEGKEIIEAEGLPEVRDAALIGAAQRVEHYEIASYGTARALARHLNFHEVADLLQETLDEEGHANDKLTALAEGGLFHGGINEEALEVSPAK